MCSITEFSYELRCILGGVNTEILHIKTSNKRFHICDFRFSDL